MKLPGVMQVTDTLEMGGLERVAVNLANALPQNRYRSFLCTTRKNGPLEELIREDVGRLSLARKNRFDLPAIQRFVRFIKDNEVQVLHAHGSSLFISVVASVLPPYPKVVWHDHYGVQAVNHRSRLLYWLPARRLASIIAASEFLAGWSRNTLGIGDERVFHIPNFVVADEESKEPARLPGVAGKRIVCVANFRPEKDHFTLLRAMEIIVRKIPQVHLLLVGNPTNLDYLETIQQQLREGGLEPNVTILRSRTDVTNILRSCDLGVLSSSCEGLPLALLEYGLAGLATVVTDVGQSKEVLEGGRVGILVASFNHQGLAAAICRLLESPHERSVLGSRFKERVELIYSRETVVKRICAVYDLALS